MKNVTIGSVNDIKGFFNKYSEIKSSHFTELFGETEQTDIETMDYLLSDLYGSRFLMSRYSELFDSKGADDVMRRIVLISDKLHFDGWKAIKGNIEKALEEDIENPLKTVKTVEVDKDGENNTDNKINAYDSEESVNADSSTHEYSDKETRLETREYSNGKTASENTVEFIDFVNNVDFIKSILKDVISDTCLDIFDDTYVCGRSSSQGGGGTSDYNDLSNKPRINNVELSGNKTLGELGIASSSRVSDVESDVSNIEHNLSDINNLIPSNASTTNKLATMADIGGGTSDYNDLSNKPRINNVELSGNKTLGDLGIASSSRVSDVESTITDINADIIRLDTDKADISVIPDVSGLATKLELQATNDSVTQLNADIDTINEVIPTSASSLNKLATVSQLPDVSNFVNSTVYNADKQVIQGDIQNNTGEIAAINLLIPANASTTNKLATMADIGGGGGSETDWIVKTFSVSGISNGRFSINVLLGEGTDGSGNYYLNYGSTEYGTNDFPEVDIIFWGVAYPIIRKGNTRVNGIPGMQLSFLLIDNNGDPSTTTSASGYIIARKRPLNFI